MIAGNAVPKQIAVAVPGGALECPYRETERLCC